MANDSLAITFRRSLVGLGLILIVGAVVGLLLGLSAYYLAQDASDRDLAEVLFIAAFVAVLGTVFQAYTYSLSYMMFDSTVLTVVTWTGILTGSNKECEWNQVQDIAVVQRGILTQIFDYGTIVVETAGTKPNLAITYVPRVQHWRDYMVAMADAARTQVSNSHPESIEM